MIHFKICDQLGKNKMTQKSLSKLTGIRPATISHMYHGDTKRIDIKQIDSLCKAFNCEISDLFEFVPDEKKKN